jgi:hypothetical protein
MPGVWAAAPPPARVGLGRGTFGLLPASRPWACQVFWRLNQLRIWLPAP